MDYTTTVRCFKARIEVDFEGVTGRVAFDENGNRKYGELAIYNFASFGSDVVGRWTPNVNSSDFGQVNFSKPIVFSDGSNKVPDSTPRSPFSYWNCEQGKEKKDLRGITTFDSLDDDPINIDLDLVCDGVIDCDNWTDEKNDCSPSLINAYIILGVINAILMLIIGLSGVLLFLYRRRGRVRASGLTFLLLTCFSCTIGLISVYLIFGKSNTIQCALQPWFINVPAAFVIG